MLQKPQSQGWGMLFNYAWALENDGQEEEAIRFTGKQPGIMGIKGAGLKQAAKLYVRKGCFEDALSCIRGSAHSEWGKPGAFLPENFYTAEIGKKQRSGEGGPRYAGRGSARIRSAGESLFLQDERKHWID